MIFNENKTSTIKFWNKYLVFRSLFVVKKIVFYLYIIRQMQLIDTRLHFTQQQEM